MLSEQDKINYQAEERKLTRKFRTGTISSAIYCQRLQVLNKTHFEKMGIVGQNNIQSNCIRGF